MKSDPYLPRIMIRSGTVFLLDWNTNISAIAGLLVAVSSVCWHLMAVEEGRSDKEHMVDHSIYI
jgi:hypothetical protein